MPGVDRLRDIVRRFNDGQLSLREAALEAGMTDEQFNRVVRGYAWMEEKAGQAGQAAGAAAKVGRRLWGRWTGRK